MGSNWLQSSTSRTTLNPRERICAKSSPLPGAIDCWKAGSEAWTSHSGGWGMSGEAAGQRPAYADGATGKRAGPPFAFG